MIFVSEQIFSTGFTTLTGLDSSNGLNTMDLAPATLHIQETLMAVFTINLKRTRVSSHFYIVFAVKIVMREISGQFLVLLVQRLS